MSFIFVLSVRIKIVNYFQLILFIDVFMELHAICCREIEKDHAKCVVISSSTRFRDFL